MVGHHHLFRFPEVLDGIPAFGFVGFQIVDVDAGSLQLFHPEQAHLAPQYLGHVFELFGLLHGQGPGPHAFKGCFDPGFPGLGLHLLQVEEAGVGLLEDLAKSPEDFVFLIRIRGSGKVFDV